jgi:hypothetical protein
VKIPSERREEYEYDLTQYDKDEYVKLIDARSLM